MINKLEMDYLQVHNNLPRDIQWEIRNQVDVEKAGFKISHSQHIHFKCDTIIHNPSNHALLHRIKQKAFIKIPNNRNADIRAIHEYSIYSNYPCIYCNTQLTELVPGFRYNLSNTREKTRYLHIKCYGKLKDAGEEGEEEEEEEEEESLPKPLYRESTHEIIDNDNLPQNPTKWTMETMTIFFNQWRELMHQFIQPETNIEKFRTIVKGIRNDLSGEELGSELGRVFGNIMVNNKEEMKSVEMTEDDKRSELERIKKLFEGPSSSSSMSIKDRRHFTYLYNIIRLFMTPI
jgi:hypothetical protein